MHRRLITLGLLVVLLTGIFQGPVYAQDSREPLTHVVQPGENLFRIALKYNLTIDALLRANALRSPDLVIVGQVLVIPGQWAGESLIVSQVAESPASGGEVALNSPESDAVAPGATDLGILGVDVEYAEPMPDYGVDQGIIPAGGVVAPVEPGPAFANQEIAASDPGVAVMPASNAADHGTIAAGSASTPVDPSLTGSDMGIIAPGAASWVYQPGIFTTGGANTRTIFTRGQQLGNDPHAFSTVGDCNSERPYFLAKFDRGEYNLGSYAHLQPVIEHFAGSFDRDSAAVWTGNHVWALFDPVWANPALCQYGETPLACEFRIQRPSMVLIRLGTNEAGSTTLFEQNLRTVIEFSIERGVIPLLGTKADRLEGSDAHNEIVRRLATEYGVPLWDFGRVADTLPGRGLQTDGFHMTYVAPDYTQPLAMQSGHSVQNLMALIALNTVWLHVLP